MSRDAEHFFTNGFPCASKNFLEGARTILQKCFGEFAKNTGLKIA